VLTFRDFIAGIRELRLDRSMPIIAHASLSSFGEVRGGAEALIGGLISSFDTFIMPVFTYKTMITPEIGPPNNALVYGSGIDTNRMVEMFTPDMPADPIIGAVAETLRSHPKAQRSAHPILSFTGVNASPILASQTIKEPFLPIQMLKEASGWVLLMGVGQTVNTSIHYAEWLAGRKQFVRWALTPEGVVAVPGFPGCSDGFEAVTPQLEDVMRTVEVGESVIQAIPLVNLADTVCALLKDDPVALLCERKDCERCNAVRASCADR